MSHDPLCEQRYQPYEEDGRCHDCIIINKVRSEVTKEAYFAGFQAALQSQEVSDGEL